MSLNIPLTVATGVPIFSPSFGGGNPPPLFPEPDNMPGCGKLLLVVCGGILLIGGAICLLGWFLR